MIELKQHAKLAQHFRSAHVFTWPVDLHALKHIGDMRVNRDSRPGSDAVVKRELRKLFGGWHVR